MGINQIKETWKGVSGDLSADNSRSYIRMFQVRFDTKTEGAILAALNADLTGSGGIKIPAMFDGYTSRGGSEADAGARMVNKSATPLDEDAQLWMVTCTYESPHAEEADFIENPLLRPAEVAWSPVIYQRPAEKDRDGNPIENSAGDAYLPPVMIDDSRLQLTITRNEAAYNPTTAQSYRNKVNSDNFLGATFSEAGKAKMMSISAKAGNENNLKFAVVTYTIQFREEGWNIEPLDQGYRKRPNADEIVNITDDFGEVVQQPVKLDGNGDVKADADPDVYLDFDVYEEVAFLPLGLDEAF